MLDAYALDTRPLDTRAAASGVGVSIGQAWAAIWAAGVWASGVWAESYTPSPPPAAGGYRFRRCARSGQ